MKRGIILERFEYSCWLFSKEDGLVYVSQVPVGIRSAGALVWYEYMLRRGRFFFTSVQVESYPALWAWGDALFLRRALSVIRYFAVQSIPELLVFDYLMQIYQSIDMKVVDKQIFLLRLFRMLGVYPFHESYIPYIDWLISVAGNTTVEKDLVDKEKIERCICACFASHPQSDQIKHLQVLKMNMGHGL